MPAKETAAKRPQRATIATCAAGLVWLAIVGVCQVVLARYEFTPGSRAAIPDRWPAAAPFPLDSSRDTLILFAHPRCPCSRATFAELDRLVARCGDRLHPIVYFTVDPAHGVVVDDTHDALWNIARAIPGVDVRIDEGARVATCFGARTSGQVVLYAPDGQLLFEGGITASRGHEGDNAGLDAIANLAARHESDTRTTPVFGCGLIDCSTTTAGGT